MEVSLETRSGLALRILALAGVALLLIPRAVVPACTVLAPWTHADPAELLHAFRRQYSFKNRRWRWTYPSARLAGHVLQSIIVSHTRVEGGEKELTLQPPFFSIVE